MKRFSQFNKDINEACVTSDANPGNSLNTGVMNHYTPIENILVNVRNIYGSRLSVVASVAEDGFSLKLNKKRIAKNKIIKKPSFLKFSIEEDVSRLTIYLYKAAISSFFNSTTTLFSICL